MIDEAAVPTVEEAAALQALHRRGVTPLDVARRYRLPLGAVMVEFVWADLHGRVPIGKPDEWSVWHAHPRDVRERFGPIRQELETAAQPVAVQRAASKAAAIRDLIEGALK